MDHCVNRLYRPDCAAVQADSVDGRFLAFLVDAAEADGEALVGLACVWQI